MARCLPTGTGALVHHGWRNVLSCEGVALWRGRQQAPRGRTHDTRTATRMGAARFSHFVCTGRAASALAGALLVG
jgi:hypothetical protein